MLQMVYEEENEDDLVDDRIFREKKKTSKINK